MHRFLIGCIGLLSVGALWGCGPAVVQPESDGSVTCAGQHDGFALSLAVTHAGDDSPVAAAQSFGGAAGVGFDVPKNGWRVVGPVSDEAQVRSGDVVLHSIQGDDGTWFIDSGARAVPDGVLARRAEVPLPHAFPRNASRAARPERHDRDRGAQEYSRLAS